MAKVLIRENDWCKVEMDEKTGEQFITTFDSKPAKAAKPAKKVEEAEKTEEKTED